MLNLKADGNNTLGTLASINVESRKKIAEQIRPVGIGEQAIAFFQKVAGKTGGKGVTKPTVKPTVKPTAKPTVRTTAAKPVPKKAVPKKAVPKKASPEKAAPKPKPRSPLTASDRILRFDPSVRT